MAAKALVTGGGGFLGGAIVRLLLARGDEPVSFSRGHYPDLERLGVRQIQGDLGDADAVRRAVAGCGIVYHVAAKAGVWGEYEAFHRANVLGARHVLDACREEGVGKLVYTSSPSVSFAGVDQDGVDESEPYPERFLAYYPQTKAEAERMTLAANGPELATVALRPHLIWGPGDNHLVPRIVAQGRAGKLRLAGSGRNLVDSTYIDNAAEAHLLAADRLTPGAPVAGKAYFISNGEPMAIADLVNGILAAAGLPPVRRFAPAGVAFAAGAAMELAYRLFRLPGEPRVTRFVARQLSTAHWFDLTAAKRDLGYAPKVGVAEGFERLAASLGGAEGR